MTLVQTATERSDKWTPKSDIGERNDLAASNLTEISSPKGGIWIRCEQRTPKDLSSDYDTPVFASRGIVVSTDPVVQLTAEISQLYNSMRSTEVSYKSRITKLIGAAAQEGFHVNPASEDNFWAFLKELPPLKRGSLVLVDNGNFRASWSNDDGDHVAIQFLGNKEVQFVVFARGTEGFRPSRTYGRCQMNQMRNKIDEQTVRDIFYA